MLLKEVLAVVGAAGLCALPAAADTMALAKDGNSAGWRADFPSGHDISITVEQLTDGQLTLSMAKTLLPPAPGEEPTVGITFTKTDFGPTTPSRIVISTETVKNATGFDWTGFHWELTPASQARFDRSAGSWTTWPFTGSAEWGNQTDPNVSLTVCGGGVVGRDANFVPTGRLVIDTPPGGLFFVLKQRAIPEPAPVAAAAAALAAVATMRRGKGR